MKNRSIPDYNPQSEIRNPQSEAERFRDLIRERTGLFSGDNWRDAFSRGVPDAAGRAKCNNLAEYYHLLRAAPTETGVWDELISAVTVGETYFFRDPNHFNALRHHILPELIRRRRDVRRLRIWNAGCSTGEEPYSVAILLRELIPDIDLWNIFILATDINKEALQKARKAHYGDWSFRQTDPALRARYFYPREDRSCLRRGVRKMVTFGYLNLVEDVYPSMPTNTNAMDLIMCRNVVIYLPEKVIRMMADKFYRCLVPEGRLIMGAAETDTFLYKQFEVAEHSGAFIYQRPVKPVWAVKTSAPPVVLPRKRPPRRKTPIMRAPSPPRKTPPSPSLPKPIDYYGEGVIHMERGDTDQALALFRTHLKKKPDSAPAFNRMARLHANAGGLGEGLQCAEQAVRHDPLFAEAHYTLALIHQENGHMDEAITELKKTLYLDPDFTLANFSLSNLCQRAGRQDEATRHRAYAIRLAAGLAPEEVVPGSYGLITAARLLAMMRP